MEQGTIQITIKRCVGNKVKYERYNDGLRYKLDAPYRQKWANAKFRLPSGKPRIMKFDDDATDQEILECVQETYSNFKFVLNDQNQTP